MQFKNSLIFLSFQLICALSTSAQNLDSLLNLLGKNKKEDIKRIDLLNTIADEYVGFNPDKGLVFADQAAMLAKKLGIIEKLARAYRVTARNYFMKRDYKAELPYIKDALALYKQAGDKAGMVASLRDLGTAFIYLRDFPQALEFLDKALLLNKTLSGKRQTGVVLTCFGRYYLEMKNIPRAIDYFIRSLKELEETADKKDRARALYLLGVAYQSLDNWAKSLDYYQQALLLYQQTKNKPEIARTYSVLGSMYMYLNQQKAVDYYEKALTIYEQLDAKKYIADVLLSMGNVEIENREHHTSIYRQRAAEFYLRSLAIYEQLNDQNGIALSFGNLALPYLMLEEYPKAIEYLKKAMVINCSVNNSAQLTYNRDVLASIYIGAPEKDLLPMGIDPKDRYFKAIVERKAVRQFFKDAGNRRREMWALFSLSDLCSIVNLPDSAYSYYRQAIALKDIVLGIESRAALSSVEAKYESRKNEDSLKFQQQLLDEQLTNQGLLSRQQQHQFEIAKNHLAILDNEKALQKVAYQVTQADLKSEQLSKKQNEKEKLLQSALVKTLKQDKAILQLNQQRQWTYIIGGLIVLAFVSFVFLYHSRLQRVRLKSAIAVEKIKKQQKEAEFQRQLADISLSALRSQMNPHFVFNCLNSIKLYTTQNNTEAATDYLTKFSRLIRLVLENSRNDKITLASELDALRLYIDMEAMRFKQKLKYNISVQKDVDIDYIEIPPLLLQPYIENAIWHGLMHNEEGGEIDIDVYTCPDESMLAVVITDNGIGRVKSAVMTTKAENKHKSHGTGVTSERLALINQIYKTGAAVVIDDLADSKGQPSGTRATIKIPLDT